MHTRRYTLFAVALAGLACLLLAAASTAQALTDKQKVGRSLFFDTNLSEPAGQACAACHGGNVGWTGRLREIGVEEQGPADLLLGAERL